MFKRPFNPQTGRRDSPEAPAWASWSALWRRVCSALNEAPRTAPPTQDWQVAQGRWPSRDGRDD